MKPLGILWSAAQIRYVFLRQVWSAASPNERIEFSARAPGFMPRFGPSGQRAGSTREHVDAVRGSIASA
jgi:hypothetical protein